MTLDAPRKTVVRGFDILELLWEIDGGGPTDVADAYDVPKSTAHEYLKTLESTGYVVNEGGEYRLSLKMLASGCRIQYRNRLFHVSRSELKKLAESTGEAVNLHVEERLKGIILCSEGSVEGINLGFYPGLEGPLHSVAPGKVILAGRPREFLDTVIESQGLTAVTDETITDRDALEEELDRIAERGYAVDWDQHVIGMGSVAAPIKPSDQVVGAVSIVCPTTTVTDGTQREKFVEAVQNTAKVISFHYEFGS